MTKSACTVPTAFPAPVLLAGTEQQKRGAKRRYSGRHQWGVKPYEDPASTRHPQPKLPEQLGAGGMRRVVEVVVVALEDVVAAGSPDDSMQHDDVQQSAPVSDDLSDVVLVRWPDEREVPAVEQRLHAGAAGDHITGRAADLGRREVKPPQDRQCDERGGE